MAELQKLHRTPTRPRAERARKPAAPTAAHFTHAQLLEAPETLRPEQVLAAQHENGNQVVQRALERAVSSPSATGGADGLSAEVTRQIQQKRGGGQPLPAPARREAEQALGLRFTDVRIHVDDSADQLSRAVHARAFTIGRDIFFKRGVFAPSTRSGRETLYHELTHVIQQGGRAGAPPLRLGAPDTPQEREAKRAGRSLASAPAHNAPAGVVQRDDDDIENAATVGDKFGAALGTFDTAQTMGAQVSYAQGTDSSTYTGNNRYTDTGARFASTMGVIKGANDVYGLGVNAAKLHNARKLHQASASEVEKGAAYSDVKNSAKSVALAPASLTGNVASTVQGIASLSKASQAATSVATTAGQVGGGFGVGLAGVDFIRNMWGMARAGHKARKLGGWTGKGGVVGDIETARNATGISTAEKEKLESLQKVGQFAHGAKKRTALLKALGVAGAGLGVVGGALALASNPAGWAVAAAGGAVGLGVGAYKVIRGMVKRSHRRDKLNAAESALGMAPYKGQGNIFKRGYKWLRGKDIEERRVAMQQKRDELQATVAAGSTADEATKTAAQAKLNALDSAQVKGKGDVFSRAMETQKQRHASTLAENLGSNAHANALGEALGISDTSGKIKKSPGLGSPIKALKRMFGHAEYGSTISTPGDKALVKKQLEREFGFK